jgi:hypothetical protein
MVSGSHFDVFPQVSVEDAENLYLSRLSVAFTAAAGFEKGRDQLVYDGTASNLVQICLPQKSEVITGIFAREWHLNTPILLTYTTSISGGANAPGKLGGIGAWDTWGHVGTRGRVWPSPSVVVGICVLLVCACGVRCGIARGDTRANVRCACRVVAGGADALCQLAERGAVASGSYGRYWVAGHDGKSQLCHDPEALSGLWLPE